MIEFYPQIKGVHIAAVTTSVALFALRGGLLLAGRQRAAHWLPLRWTSWAIDTVLLSAALMLLTILPGGVFANHWLSVKLGLLVAYVGLGSFALRHARTPAARSGGYVAALAVAALMASIARSHHPLGFLRLLGA
jgi:uncharacterized membrane protein SirB2